MMLTYEEFKKLVPKETLDFVNFSLPILQTHIILQKDMLVYFNKDCKDIPEKDNRVLLSLLFAFYENNPYYASLLTKFHYNRNAAKIEMPSNYNTYSFDFRTNVFQECAKYFCICNYDFHYKILTPLTIVNSIMQTNIKNYSDENDTPKIFQNIKNMKEFASTLNALYNQEFIQKMAPIQEKICDNLPIDTIAYLENASLVYQVLEEEKNNLSTYILKEEDITILSLFLGIVAYPQNTFSINEQEILISYFSRYHITFDTIVNTLHLSKFQEKIKNQRTDYFIIDTYFSKYIENKITIAEIISDFGKRDFTKSIALEKLFQELKQEISILQDCKEIPKKEAEIEKLQQEKMQKRMESYEGDVQKYLETVSRIHTILIEYIKTNFDYNTNIIQTKKDVQKLSMVMAMFYQSSLPLPFFQKNGITIQNILSCCTLNSLLFQNIDTSQVNYNILYTDYLKYLNKENITLKEIIKSIFDSNINESTILEKMMAHLGISYSLLKEEIQTEKEQIQELTLQERLHLLLKIEIPNINITDFNSIITFGNTLTPHILFIHSEKARLILNNSSEKAINLINQICQKKQNPFLNLRNKFYSLFKERKEIMSHQELVTEINKSITVLSQELMEYPNLLKYMGLLQKKIYTHLMFIQKVILEKEKKTQKPSCLQDDLEYADFLENNTYEKALKDKEDTLNTTNIYIKQELLELNQTIQSYSLTLKALTIVRDDLLPMIKTEFTILKNQKNQKQSMEIYTNSMQLIQNLLLRNADAANVYLTKLKQASSGEFSITKIEYDVNTYFNQLQSTNTLMPQATLTSIEDPENPLKHVLKP